jgi:Putative prokaryotic signal transducing protein
MLSQLVWIKTYPEDAAARAAQRLLDANGIHSLIADDYGGAGPALRYACGMRLAVREEDAKTARVILEDGGGT